MNAVNLIIVSCTVICLFLPLSTFAAEDYDQDKFVLHTSVIDMTTLSKPLHEMKTSVTLELKVLEESDGVAKRLLPTGNVSWF